MAGVEIRKKLPIGIESFEEIRTEGFYYVDKTLMIRDLMNSWGKVNLFTRPRRFGKSLNMSMLKAFFEIGCDESLFDGLAIAEETKLCETYMGKFPVISVSLKSVSGVDYSSACSMMRAVIGNEARRFETVLMGDETFTETEKGLYKQLIALDSSGQNLFSMSESTMKESLKTLSALLYKHYGKKVIILIDEYDVPLAKANDKGYYADMAELIRGMFDQALKTNESLYLAVLTGCLRVSKESIFTGLNNPKMYTILDANCDEQFGFTDAEVRQMLDYYDLTDYYDVTKEWYDGYKIGRASVYNPWDVINWCDQLLTNPNKAPKSYWANTSGNDEVRKFIRRMGNGVTKAQIERLISGETVQKKIVEQLTYNSLYDSIENMWSLLYATGYLTQSESPVGDVVQLTIPNEEVRGIFTSFILDLFEEEVAGDGAAVTRFCGALKAGDPSDVERLLTEFMKRTISIRDTAEPPRTKCIEMGGSFCRRAERGGVSRVRKEVKENFYHGILLGIIGLKSGWDVDSNRESGEGYYDISAGIEDEGIGIIIEVKYAENERFEEECQNALDQINKNGYADELKKDGMWKILKYGIACYKKRCKVVLQQEG